MQEEFKKLLPAVIKTGLDFLEIHRKVIFGNTSVIVVDMLGERPEAFDAIDVIFGALINHALAVVDRVLVRNYSI